MIDGTTETGTRGLGRASIPTVARRGRASAGVLALVVMTTAACGADEPAAPPSNAPPSPPSVTAPPPEDGPPPRSLARRIAPLLRLPSEPPPPPLPKPVAEGIPATGIEECDDYLRDYMACFESTMPPESVEPIREALAEAARSFATMKESVDIETIRETCRSARDATREAVTSLGCVWE